MADFDYPEFLAARLDEWEVKASGILEEAPDWIAWWPRTVIADIAAKRSILNRYAAMRTKPWPREMNDHTSGGIPYVLLDIIDMCRPFADHPDYPGGE
jgi:hypothetical protein